MGGKKKVGRKWGDRKSAHFFKNQKNGESQKKKKMGEKWGDKKTRPFLKNGDVKIEKNAQTPGVCEKIQFFVFSKKKRWGENGH